MRTLDVQHVPSIVLLTRVCNKRERGNFVEKVTVIKNERTTALVIFAYRGLACLHTQSSVQILPIHQMIVVARSHNLDDNMRTDQHVWTYVSISCNGLL